MSDASPATLEPAALPEEGTERRAARGLALLGAALALGVLGHLLLGEAPGIGVSLWIAAGLAAPLLLARRLGIPLRREGLLLFLPALLFSAALAWRASPSLAALNLVGVLLSLAFGARWARSGDPRRAGVLDYLVALPRAAGHAAAGAVLLGLSDVRWRGVSTRGRSERAAVLARGLLLAAPLLFVFGALFVAADPIFGEMVAELAGGGWEARLEAVLRTVLLGWLAAGFLRATLLQRREERPVAAGEARRGTLDPLEAIVVLGLLAALFLAFVLVQFRYLFGGAELVQAVAGMSFAEYARRGFFELVAVAALLLPVLLALDALVADGGTERPRALRGLSLALVALLLVIIASAAERMRLYQAAYGLTEDRLYASAFMGWLAVVFVWLAATVLRGRRERFAWGALLAGFATLGALNLLDPDARIARVNLALAERTERLDAAYLRGLGPDAVPVLLAAVGRLPEARACEVAANLVGRLPAEGERPGWTSWNRGRARAERLLREREAGLRETACFPAPARPLPGTPPRR